MADPETITLLRIFGLTACFASAIVFLADLLLLGGRLGPDQPNVFYKIPEKSDLAVLLGHTLGVLFIPICAAGMVLVWYGLRPIGFWPATLITLGVGFLFAVGPFIHGMYAPIGAVLAERTGSDSTAFDAILAKQRLYFFAPGLFVIVIFMIASIALSWAILSGGTRFPWPLGLWCLGPLTGLFMFSTRFLPPDIAGVISPACVHVAYLPFMIVATWTLWDG